jgi:hypothetical protein
LSIVTRDRMRVTALPARTFQPRRYRPGNQGTWSGHLPFACDLIAALRPALLVELGTHYGESYFGMCQAVLETAISCQCYAVDTWIGDRHASFYDESVFQEVKEWNDSHYAAFSHLLRTTFDEALANFADGSVDLLHIDGLHTYEAVRHDFDSWFPKVRPGGIVLLHDTAVRHHDFRVWRLWEELCREYPHFVFTHCWGLGVLRKPGGHASDSELLEALFSGSSAEQDFLRHYYSSLATALESADQVHRPPPRSSHTVLQVYPHGASGYAEATSATATIPFGEWQQVALELRQGSSHGPVRLDASDRACVVELAAIWLKRAVDGAVLTSWTSVDELRALRGMAGLIPLPDQTRARFLSTGGDPQFLLPDLDRAVTDQPVIVEVRLRVDADVAPALALLRSADAARIETVTAERDHAYLDKAAVQEAARLERESVDRDCTAARAERDLARGERDLAQAQGHQLAAEVRNLQAERVAVAGEYRRVHMLNESLTTERAAAAAEYKRVSLLNDSLREDRDAAEAEFRRVAARNESEIQALSGRVQAVTGRLADSEGQTERLKAELDIVYRSRSWWVTAPLRSLGRVARRLLR